jgi:hypothetical protein
VAAPIGVLAQSLDLGSGLATVQKQKLPSFHKA